MKIFKSIYNKIWDFLTIQDQFRYLESKIEDLQQKVDRYSVQIESYKNYKVPIYTPTSTQATTHCPSCRQDLAASFTCMSTSCPYATQITCNNSCK